MFRKKKGPGETQGFNRISRLIEDRQRELDDDAPQADLEEDTILLSQQVAAQDTEADGEEFSLLGVRGPGSAPQRAESPAYSDTAQDRAAALGEEDSRFSSQAPSYFTEPEAPAYAAPSVEAPRAMVVPNLGYAGSGASLVAADANWEGKLHSDGDIRVEGVVHGEIDTSAALIIAPRARVHGTVRARTLTIAGDVEGDITCEDRLEILPGGSARGQINSGTLVVHEGAYIDSRFQMRRDSAETSR